MCLSLVASMEPGFEGEAGDLPPALSGIEGWICLLLIFFPNLGINSSLGLAQTHLDSSCRFQHDRGIQWATFGTSLQPSSSGPGPEGTVFVEIKRPLPQPLAQATSHLLGGPASSGIRPSLPDSTIQFVCRRATPHLGCFRVAHASDSKRGWQGLFLQGPSLWTAGWVSMSQDTD